MAPDETVGTRDSGSDALSVQIDGGKGQPDRMLVVSRPRNGLVEVREFHYGCGQSAPLEYTEDADVLYGKIERLVRQRRRVSQSLAGLRLWLDGHS